MFRIQRPMVIGLALILGALPMASAETDWSRFRGPNGSGVSDALLLPATVDLEQNLGWSTEIPFGRSSPVVGEKNLFVTAIEDGKLITLAVNRSTGKIAWQSDLEPRRADSLYKATDSASPTPVTDGTDVYVFFQEYGLVSYDQSGKKRWEVPLGPFRNYYGMAASPILADGRIIQVCDQAEGSFVLAVDAASGAVVWKTKRSGRLESYSTPIVFDGGPSGEKILLILGSRWLDAYDPMTGEHLWSQPGLGSGPVASPVLVDGTVFVSAQDHAEGGWPEFASMISEHDKNKDGSLTPEEVSEVWLHDHFGWLDADADGVLTEKDWSSIGEEMSNSDWGVAAWKIGQGEPRVRLWNYQKNVPYIPTLLVHSGVVFVVRDGVLTTLDAESGDVLKRDRLGEGVAKIYASPVLADGKLFVASVKGKVLVVSAEADWKLLAESDLGEEIYSSPAIAQGHLYVRTRDRLLDFVGPRKQPVEKIEEVAPAGPQPQGESGSAD